MTTEDDKFIKRQQEHYETCEEKDCQLCQALTMAGFSAHYPIEESVKK